VDIKKFLTEKGMKLMQDPRFMKLMQDERVMKAMMGAFQMRGKIQESLDQRVEVIAKKLNLATKAEIRDLKRALRKMENELEKARKAEAAAKGAS
jgi:hypothetical protein